MTLPPGTLLQLMYLKERLGGIPPGRFAEVGVGQGHLSACLLELGWRGIGFELDADSARSALARNRAAVDAGHYEVQNVNWLDPAPDLTVDLVISCMVLEHFDENAETQFMKCASSRLSARGRMIGLVPASPEHWGVEDDIAGHFRRYTRASLGQLAQRTSFRLEHIAGLTYPLSNFLLPISNFLVARNESNKLALSKADQTTQSGRRSVRFKTTFPPVLKLLLNETTLLPLHLLQKHFAEANGALVLYFEATPRQQ